METEKIQAAASRPSEKGRPEGKPGVVKPSRIRHLMRPFSWLARGPADWFGRKNVLSGAGLVGDLWKGTRAPPKRDSRFKSDELGGFDLAATAFSYGITVEALEQRLAQRQRTTALVAYGALSIAGLSVLFWIHSAINQPYTLARVMMVWEFVPFISLFLLLAFYNALLNFQIRVRRSAGWREFLSTEEGFFPR